MLWCSSEIFDSCETGEREKTVVTWNVADGGSQDASVHLADDNDIEKDLLVEEVWAQVCFNDFCYWKITEWMFYLY